MLLPFRVTTATIGDQPEKMQIKRNYSPHSIYEYSIQPYNLLYRIATKRHESFVFRLHMSVLPQQRPPFLDLLSIVILR